MRSLTYPHRILVYGSASRGGWSYGSEVDMVIFSEKTASLRTKRRVYDIYWSLNEKYGLGLLQAPAPHPPLVFVDNPLKRLVAWLVLFSSLTSNLLED
ncbi:MAG: nucleotidyltransferase domain-containing protein [Nitrososphaerales archaeon]